MLDDDIRCARHIHLDGKTCGTLQSVGLIGDAVVLPQDACAADGTSYDGGIGAESLLGHVVGPRLCRDGVAVAHHGVILRRCQHIDGIQEVEPVGGAAQVKGQLVGLGIVTVSVIALGERAGHQRSTVHLGESGQIHAHLYRVATAHGIADGVTLRLRAGHQGDAHLTAEGDGGVADQHLAEHDGLRAREVGEAEPQHAATEAHSDGITQGEVLGIRSLTAVGDGGGGAPAGHPFLFVCHHITTYLHSAHKITNNFSESGQ